MILLDLRRHSMAEGVGPAVAGMFGTVNGLERDRLALRAVGCTPAAVDCLAAADVALAPCHCCAAAGTTRRRWELLLVTRAL